MAISKESVSGFMNANISEETTQIISGDIKSIRVQSLGEIGIKIFSNDGIRGYILGSKDEYVKCKGTAEFAVSIQCCDRMGKPVQDYIGIPTHSTLTVEVMGDADASNWFAEILYER